jgi:hypothetical protein
LLHLIECHSKLARLFYANRNATLPKYAPAVLALPAPSAAHGDLASTAMTLSSGNNSRKSKSSSPSSSFAPTHPSPQLISNTLAAAGGVTRIADAAAEIGAFVAASNRSHLAGMFLHDLQWPSAAATALSASQAASQHERSAAEVSSGEGGRGISKTARPLTAPLSAAQTESLRHELACLNLVSHELVYQVR